MNIDADGYVVANGRSVETLNAQVSAANSPGAFPGNSSTAIQQREAGDQVLTLGLAQTARGSDYNANGTVGTAQINMDPSHPIVVQGDAETARQIQETSRDSANSSGQPSQTHRHGQQRNAGL